MKGYGIQIWVDGRWVFVPAKDMAEATALNVKSQGYQVPSRIVYETEFGDIVTVFATD